MFVSKSPAARVAGGTACVAPGARRRPPVPACTPSAAAELAVRLLYRGADAVLEGEEDAAGAAAMLALGRLLLGTPQDGPGLAPGLEALLSAPDALARLAPAVGRA
jgi:hypothetical protein